MDIENKLFELYIQNNNHLSKKIIDACDTLPSYNILCKEGYKIDILMDKFNRICYNENPKVCPQCNKTILYEKKNLAFCCKSCSVSYNNLLRPKLTKRCQQCKKPFSGIKFCSSECSSQSRRESSIQQWLNGEHPGYTGKSKQLCAWVRLYLFETRGTQCSQCGWDEKHPMDNLPLTEIDHIDGDASNNKLENLRILCPNCHSMTPTFRTRNKNSSRSRK